MHWLQCFAPRMALAALLTGPDSETWLGEASLRAFACSTTHENAVRHLLESNRTMIIEATVATGIDKRHSANYKGVCKGIVGCSATGRTVKLAANWQIP